MNFQDEWKELLALFIEEASIKKEPEYELRDCLNCLTKQDLLEISSLHGADWIRPSYKKQTIVNNLAEEIEASFREEIAYLTKEQYTALVDGKLMERADRILEEVMEVEYLVPLMDLGWLFLFEEKDGYSFIMPVELSSTLITLLDFADAFPQFEKNQQMQNVLKAMINLYGVFDAAFFEKVWNAHYSDQKVTEFEVHGLLYMVNLLNDAISTNGELIYHPNYFEEEDAESLWLHLIVYDKYWPTKKDLAYYSDHFFDTGMPEYRKF